MRRARAGVLLVTVLLLGGCAGAVPRARLGPIPSASPVTGRAVPIAPAAPSGSNALTSDFVAGPAVGSLPLSVEQAATALAAFRLSCPAVTVRADRSGLTSPGDWTAACTAAVSNGDPRTMFAEQFETVRVGSGDAFATGYYEPEIEGSRVRDDRHTVPIYGEPDDLVEVDLGKFAESLKGKIVCGRVSGTAVVPYYERAEIEDGALTGHAPVIAWVADPVEFYFLQVQGSGRIRLPDGGIMRVGYAGQNGRDYVGIGALMRQRRLLGPDQQSMQGIMAWLRANPDQGRAIMRENKSYVFFREITGQGPVGALNLPVTGRATVAVDPAFVPLGAPVWLQLDRPEATGLWVAQDTGGAIKGANRFDTFWGAGNDARRIAGGMSGRGTALILVPKGTLARIADAARPHP